MNNMIRKMMMILACVSICSTPKASESSQFDFSGYLMLDYDQYDSFFLERSDESESDSELRKARFSFKYNFNKDWQSKLQLSLDDSDFEIKDAYFKYSGWDFADLTVGQQKESFGLEKLMGSKDQLFIERSMVNQAFAPGRTTGANFSGSEKSVNWQLGYFQDTDGDSDEAITGRVTWAPWKSKDNEFIHIGAAFSERYLNGDEFRINEVIEVHLSDSIVEGNTIEVDKASLVGVEALWQKNGFTGMTEWQQNSVQGINGSVSDYEGGFWAISYRLSGENRKYKKGILKGLSNISNSGEWEVSFRASQLKLLQENRKAESYTLGLNYYFNDNIKLMANYTEAELFEDELSQGEGDALSLRFQVRF